MVVPSAKAPKIRSRFILLSSLGIIGTLLAVRRNGPGHVFSVTARAESVMRVQTLRRRRDEEGLTRAAAFLNGIVMKETPAAAWWV